MLSGVGSVIIYLTLVLAVEGQDLEKQHKLSCTDNTANASSAIQHFACKTNDSYNLTISSSKPGIYIDMKVTMYPGDSFVLSTGTGNDTRTLINLTGEHLSYPIVYFIPGDVVTISANATKSSPGDRTFTGSFHEGCDFNLTSTTPVFHFPPYSNGSGIFICDFTIRASGSREMNVYASVDSLTLKGKSNLTITGQPPNFPAVFKAETMPDFDFIGNPLTLSLALDVSIADQSGTVLIDSVYKNCSGMLEMTSGSSKTLYLPPNMTENFLERLSCRWVVRGQDNNILGLELFSFSLAGAEDILVVTDGGRRDSPVVLQASQGDAQRVTGLVSRTSSKYIWLSLNVAEYNTSDSFVAQLTESAEGGHLKNQASNIKISGKSKDSVYLLEVAPSMQVLLSTSAISLKGSASVEVVSDFYRNGPVLQKFSMGTESYPVASLNNKVMLRAQGFTTEDSFVFSFIGVEPGCHSTTLETSGLYSLSGNCNAICTWAINPSNSSAKTQKFTLMFNHLNLDANDNVTISSLAHPNKALLLVNSSYSSVKPVEMSSVTGAYVMIRRNKCAQENGTVASGSTSGVLGSNFAPKLAPGVSYSFQSPLFPNQYPLNSTRSWAFNGTGIGGFHLTFMSMDIAQGHALNLTSGNQTVPLKGSTLPADIVVEKPKMYAQFAAPIQPGYSSGYGFDALLTPLDSAQVVVNKETSQVETPSFPALVNESKTFLWFINVPNFETKKMAVAIMFNVSHLHKSTKSSGTLTVYDGNSIRSPILGNLTGENLLTSTDTILVKFVTVAGEGSALQLNFTTYRCNMSDTCNNSKICIHEDWRCNGINDCGDNTDEVGCSYHPTPSPSPTTPSPPGPEPAPSKGGVSTAAFVVTVLLALVIGAVGALFVPVLVRRYRAYRYSRFTNVAVSE
uniref:Putative cubilin n=1 Tax=Amblyomma triste TaxID=251400 RepID=A0A023G678_AMBTT